MKTDRFSRACCWPMNSASRLGRRLASSSSSSRRSGAIRRLPSLAGSGLGLAAGIARLTVDRTVLHFALRLKRDGFDPAPGRNGQTGFVRQKSKYCLTVPRIEENGGYLSSTGTHETPVFAGMALPRLPWIEDGKTGKCEIADVARDEGQTMREGRGGDLCIQDWCVAILGLDLCPFQSCDLIHGKNAIRRRGPQHVFIP